MEHDPHTAHADLSSLDLIAEAARRLAFDRPHLDPRHIAVQFQVLSAPGGPRVEYVLGNPSQQRVYGAYDLYPFPDPPVEETEREREWRRARRA